MITNICFLKYFFEKSCQQYTKYNKYDKERDKTDIENTCKYIYIYIFNVI